MQGEQPVIELDGIHLKNTKRGRDEVIHVQAQLTPSSANTLYSLWKLVLLEHFGLIQVL